MMDKMNVLDNGYVALVESWGSDERVIEAARMSTDKGFQGWGPTPICTKCGSTRVHRNVLSDHPGVGGCEDCTNGYIGDKPGDEKLLRYLWTHKHYTPFEMAGMTIEVQAPIFVFREWHRHRTLSAALDDDIGIDAYNELSARYTPLPDVNYVPTVERVMMHGGKNKQAQGVTHFLTPTTADMWRDRLIEVYAGLEDEYQAGLMAGVPKELARLCIPVGRYSRMRASANLRNWLAFLELRMDEAAQLEIRQYANVVGSLIATAFPRTWELFSDR